MIAAKKRHLVSGGVLLICDLSVKQPAEPICRLSRSEEASDEDVVSGGALYRLRFEQSRLLIRSRFFR